MQSQAIQKEEKASPLFVEAEKLFNEMKELSQTVAHRAYQFFEERGRQIGHELEDWFRAESELMRRVPVEIRETDEQIIVRAEVPGFTASEIKVSVEPKNLIISGQTEQPKEETTAQKVYSEICAARFCRHLELPAEVDPTRAAATLRNGILELTMTKVAADKAVNVEVKSA
ncbi:MAG TPA: Hsp20 family protein [Blastocatellia bacterium]|nr:Hsp20 family protein [Blastocatellia bacterium]